MRGVLGSVLGMIRGGATHVAVATDRVIESFRNRLWPGYKTGAAIEPDLLAQFDLLEKTLSAAGVVVWPMIEFEADDALAAAAATAVDEAKYLQLAESLAGFRSKLRVPGSNGSPVPSSGVTGSRSNPGYLLRSGSR